MSRFFDLTLMSLEDMVTAGFAATSGSMLLMAVGVALLARERQPPRLNATWVVLGFIPITISAWGSIFANAGKYGALDVTWHVDLLYVFAASVVPISIAVIWTAVPGRILSIAYVSLVGHLSLWAMFGAIMSVTGDWI